MGWRMNLWLRVELRVAAPVPQEEERDFAGRESREDEVSRRPQQLRKPHGGESGDGDQGEHQDAKRALGRFAALPSTRCQLR